MFQTGQEGIQKTPGLTLLVSSKRYRSPVQVALVQGMDVVLQAGVATR